MRVFLDANIIFSAADPESATRFLLDMVIRRATAVTSMYAWEEAKRNIERKRPAFLGHLAELEHLLEFTSRITILQKPDLPDDDKPIVGAAVASECSHLWTSDQRHFGGFYGKRIGQTKIVSSIMLADELKAKRWL